MAELRVDLTGSDQFIRKIVKIAFDQAREAIDEAERKVYSKLDEMLEDEEE